MSSADPCRTGRSHADPRASMVRTRSPRPRPQCRHGDVLPHFERPNAARLGFWNPEITIKNGNMKYQKTCTIPGLMPLSSSSSYGTRPQTLKTGPENNEERAAGRACYLGDAAPARPLGSRPLLLPSTPGESGWADPLLTWSLLS